ncbi:hypothetical protein L873DRAFT_684248 [Choiromyces venosus 120613-1]|uniref:Uncharacterized protein n=1 Tax=Choiromyces venosus 120613-1 TaxID=1336337 RepID=A0A3N4ISX1_9PEZI|nr:hypothetical protein L873DRAFT_684248 [Choiromyces venosus 120613-1]
MQAVDMHEHHDDKGENNPYPFGESQQPQSSSLIVPIVPSNENNENSDSWYRKYTLNSGFELESKYELQPPAVYRHHTTQHATTVVDSMKQFEEEKEKRMDAHTEVRIQQKSDMQMASIISQEWMHREILASNERITCINTDAQACILEMLASFLSVPSHPIWPSLR